jgi:hypothetical protein
MAKLSAPNHGKSGSLPFLNSLLDNGSIPDCNEIREPVLYLNETQSKAGYLIITHKWQHMVYKSSPMAEIIEELMTDLPNTNPGPGLWFVGDTDESCGYYLETDESTPYLWTRRKGMGKSRGIQRVYYFPPAEPGSSHKKPRQSTPKLG